MADPYLRRDDGTLLWTKKHILAGVAFYQSLDDAGGYVRCHGPIDLHGVVHEEMTRVVKELDAENRRQRR